MSSYILSEDLRSSIESLFNDKIDAYSVLGIEDGDSAAYEPNEQSSASLLTRLRSLQRKLESYVRQMPAESSEIGCDDTTDALRMQAIGLLLALREIQRHVPEIVLPDSSKAGAQGM